MGGTRNKLLLLYHNVLILLLLPTGPHQHLEVSSSEDINRSRGGSAQQRAVAVISPILCSAAGALAGYNPITMSPSQSPGQRPVQHRASLHPSIIQSAIHTSRFYNQNEASQRTAVNENAIRISDVCDMISIVNGLYLLCRNSKLQFKSTISAVATA